VAAKLAKEQNMATKQMIEEAMQAAKDAKDSAKAEREYNKRSTVEPSKDVRDEVRGQKGYAKGGKVGSASKRADGVATKGKTKGMMVKMAGGGMC
jgi:hypothetical protein